MQADSANWITADNLMEKIETALENPTSFEFAIESDGTRVSSKFETKYLERAPTIQQRMYEYSVYQQKTSDEQKAEPQTAKADAQ